MPRIVVRLPVCAKLLTVPTVASIALSALFLTGCATHRKSVKAEQAVALSETIRSDSVIRQALDSASEVVEVRQEAVMVPMSEVTLTIAADSLRSLPPGASYSERRGQASVKVSRRAATASEPEYIYVYASCDSLQLQCEHYERTIKTLRSEYVERMNELQTRLAATESQHTELEEKPPNAIGTALKWYLSGFLSGVVLGTIIIFFIKLKT